MNDELNDIRKALEYNEQYQFKFETKFKESSFKNHLLKNVFSGLCAAQIPFEPSIMDELLHAEIRERSRAIIKEHLKGATLDQLANSIAECNTIFGRDLLARKEAELAETELVAPESVLVEPTLEVEPKLEYEEAQEDSSPKFEYEESEESAPKFEYEEAATPKKGKKK